MRNIGLVSAAVIAMAAMAGTVAASAPPVIQSQSQVPPAESMGSLEDVIMAAVEFWEAQGLSGEAAQQQITGFLQDYMAEFPTDLMALDRAHLSLINGNRLRRGSDGDLAVSALLAARGGERNRESRTSFGGGGSSTLPRQPPAAVQGSPTAGDAGRNVPGNAAAGQPATDAATTGIRRSRATYDSDLDGEYDPDLDDEAGEPD